MLDWFVTFGSSIVQTAFVVSPIRLFVTATILSHYKQVHEFNVGNWIGIKGNWGRQQAIAKWRCKQAQYAYEWFLNERNPNYPRPMTNPRKVAMQKLPACYRVPNFASLYRAGKLKIAVSQVKRFWVEALTWIILTALVTAILFLQSDFRLFHLNRLFQNRFVSDLNRMKRMTDYFMYMENYFIPRVFYATVDNINSTAYLLGAIRVRQTRLNYVSCPRNLPLSLRNLRCTPGENAILRIAQFDTNDYLPFWVPLNRSLQLDFEDEISYEITTPWTYSNQYNTFSSIPLLGTNLKRNYPLGGYVVDLKFGEEIILATLNGLRVTNWIDGQTSSIFTEVAFFSVYSQHVTSLFLVVESLSYGSVSVSFETLSYKQPYFYSRTDLAVAAMQIIYFALEIFLIYDFVQQCQEVKWQRKGVFQILFNGWAILAIIDIILSFIAYVFYVFFIYYSVTIIKHYKEDTAKFSSFATPARLLHYYKISLACACFVSYIRTLKVFRCSSTVTIMIDAIHYAKNDLFNVTVVVLIILVAFSSYWTLSFGYIRLYFRGFQTAFLSITSLMLGIEPNASDGEPISSKLFQFSIFVFMFLAVVVFSNVFTAAVENGFKKMRVSLEERSSDPVETLAVVWLYDKALNALGFTKLNLKLKVRKLI